jgi:hypothetical protein
MEHTNISTNPLSSLMWLDRARYVYIKSRLYCIRSVSEEAAAV